VATIIPDDIVKECTPPKADIEQVAKYAPPMVVSGGGGDVAKASVDPKVTKSITAATALIEKSFEEYLSGELPDILKQPSQPKSDWFQKEQREPPMEPSQGQSDAHFNTHLRSTAGLATRVREATTLVEPLEEAPLRSLILFTDSQVGQKGSLA